MPSPVELPLRITVLHPPPGVLFQLQRGRSELTPPRYTTPEALIFDFTVRLGDNDRIKSPRFLGEYTQGPPAARFVYVNSGTSAGQAATPWSRRAKVPLTPITWSLVDDLLGHPDAVLEARIAGTGRDGGPACASVPLLESGWRVVRLDA